MIKILKQCVLLIFILTEVLYCTNTALDSALTDIKNKYSVVGMSVLVTSADSVVYSGSFGMRNLEQNLPVNGNTCYRIASISKMVTATALFQLFEQGLFKLDDDVSNFLGFDLKNPNYPDQPITFHQLLSHTGSLRDGSGYSNFLNASYNNTPPPKIKELLQPDGAYYSSDMFSNTKAPQDLYFQYANINYGIIGTLIERLSGLRFDIYCRQNIFEPLGIKGSFNIQDIDSITNVAVLYRKSGSNWVPQVDDYGGQHPPERDLSGFTIGDNGLLFAPQGGLRISAEDLSLFMRAHQLGGGLGSVTILQDTTTARMHETFWQYTGSNGNNYYGIFNNYAAGNHLTESLIPSQSLRGHPGEAYGLISDMYFCKIGDYGIILITNGGLWGLRYAQRLL